ncbi:MAG: winged helix-turn-helix domain-containing protein [Verrucomicrobia bacterium]|nr:winged helix-turn-helix domain-containing protein [Verrucomicrobiota bacterium]
MPHPYFKLTLPQAGRQAPDVQAQLQAGLQAGQWRTAGQVREWLEKTHHIKRAERSIYYWLGKLSGVLRVPRPVHIKRDPSAAAAFRAEFGQKFADLQLPAGRAVKVWVLDEARFWLHSQTRRCCGLRGCRWGCRASTVTNGNTCMGRWK